MVGRPTENNDYRSVRDVTIYIYILFTTLVFIDPEQLAARYPRNGLITPIKIRRCLPSWEACNQRATEHEVQRSQTVWQFLLAPEHILLQLL